jgi:hypothetical protein
MATEAAAHAALPVGALVAKAVRNDGEGQKDEGHARIPSR